MSASTNVTYVDCVSQMYWGKKCILQINTKNVLVLSSIIQKHTVNQKNFIVLLVGKIRRDRESKFSIEEEDKLLCSMYRLLQNCPYHSNNGQEERRAHKRVNRNQHHQVDSDSNKLTQTLTMPTTHHQVTDESNIRELIST